jgi:hypothetical protein
MPCREANPGDEGDKSDESDTPSPGISPEFRRFSIGLQAGTMGDTSPTETRAAPAERSRGLPPRRPGKDANAGSSSARLGQIFAV